MASKKYQREKYVKDLTRVFCMYCLRPHYLKDLFKREGRFDVCRDDKCIEAYYRDRRAQMNRAKQETRKKTLEENYPDPTWMTGE